MIQDIRINTEAFEEHGWRPAFNQALYEELVAEQVKTNVITPDKYVTLQIEPHPAPVAADSRRINSALHQGGNYNETSATIKLLLDDDEANSNRILHHLTQHWLQDVTDMYPRSRTKPGRYLETVKAVRYEWPAMTLGLIVAGSLGGTMYESTHNTSLVAAGVIPVLGLTAAGALHTASILHLPWERDAYRFEQDPLVLHKYGKIITHEVITPEDEGDGSEPEAT